MLNVFLNGTEKLRMEAHENDNTVIMTATSLASSKCLLSIIPNKIQGLVAHLPEFKPGTTIF